MRCSSGSQAARQLQLPLLRSSVREEITPERTWSPLWKRTPVDEGACWRGRLGGGSHLATPRRPDDRYAPRCCARASHRPPALPPSRPPAAVRRGPPLPHPAPALRVASHGRRWPPSQRHGRASVCVAAVVALCPCLGRAELGAGVGRSRLESEDASHELDEERQGGVRCARCSSAAAAIVCRRECEHCCTEAQRISMCRAGGEVIGFCHGMSSGCPCPCHGVVCRRPVPGRQNARNDIS